MTTGQRSVVCLCALFFIMAGAASLGFQVRQEPSRYDHLVIYDPSSTVTVATLSVDSLEAVVLGL